MSLATCVYVPSGVVMSADSRVTTPVVLQDPMLGLAAGGHIPMIVSDSAEKLFLLWGKIGVTTCGAGFIEGAPIAHHIKRFELANEKPLPPKAAADALLAYFQAITPVPGVTMLLAGYDAGTPWVLGVNVFRNEVKRWNTSDTSDPGEVWYGCVYDGDNDIVSRLLVDKFRLIYVGMQIQEAVDLSRHFIRTTIDQMRFEPRIPTVGGAIDTLLLTPDSCEFIARKVPHVQDSARP